MIGIPTPPGTWRRELQRSRQSLSAVNRFWHGLYGKAVICPFEVQPDSAERVAADTTTPAVASHSMYERVGSRVIDS